MVNSDKTFKTLEFDVILKRLSAYSKNEHVQERILSLTPVCDIDEARTLQRETTEAMITLLKIGTPPVQLNVSEVHATVTRAEQGGILNPVELLRINRLLYVSRRMKSYLNDISEECSVLINARNSIITAKHLEDRISECIISENEIADEASSELASIRRKTKTINAKIRDSLNTMIRSAHYKKFLQDALISVRNDRFVIPVKSEYRGEVPGIVHDMSQTGATLFVEPMSIVEMNNQISNLKGLEEREIERILFELSALVADNSHAVFVDYALLCDLDFWFCKGKFSLDIGGNEPTLNDKGIIKLKKARHPLIDKDVVVANDIELGEKYDTLVVTGPNTGGKTVTLKTVGLFSLMAGAGLHLPLSEGSEIGLFENVFADIGDEQSIEQSLSTFSSHMVNIVGIINNLTPNSLVLFDELGGGTDPTEGAALAISILEFLRERGAKILATTHYSELKLYALSTENVENASCEFDINSLRPTYKLLIGVPGKSNAFAISKRLGLDERVIGRASELLSDENVKFEDVVCELEENRKKAERDKFEALRMKDEMISMREQLLADRSRLKENKGRIIDDAHREAKIIIMEAKDEANKIIRELEKLRIEGATKEKIKEKTANARTSLKTKEETIDKKMQNVKAPRKTFSNPPKNLLPGTTVKILDMNQEATVIKEPDKNGMVKVMAGIIKLDAHITNLKKVDESKTDELVTKYIKTTHVFESKTKNATTEIDVRGQDSESAMMNVGKFIDDCYLASITPVTIIHGKGTGVLRKKIQAFLKTNKHVKSFRNGKYGEGEMGVTVVELA